MGDLSAQLKVQVRRNDIRWSVEQMYMRKVINLTPPQAYLLHFVFTLCTAANLHILSGFTTISLCSAKCRHWRAARPFPAAWAGCGAGNLQRQTKLYAVARYASAGDGSPRSAAVPLRWSSAVSPGISHWLTYRQHRKDMKDFHLNNVGE